MRVAVIGAGMTGVAAAHALAADGHAVTVFERRASVAEETSFAPPGLAAAALAAPWTPAAGWMQRTLGAVDAHGLRELGAAFGPATGAPARSREARAQTLHRLIAIGGERIDELARGLALEFERGSGLLLTLPDAAAVAQAELACEWLRAAGETVEWADAARQRAIEPGRAVHDEASRAVYLPSARIGNTREWTQLLRVHAQQLGVRFLFQHEVAGLAAGPRPTLRFTAAAGATQEASFDAAVVCAALESSRLLGPLGLRLPWKPVRGYSLTVPAHLREAAPDAVPRAALIDVRSGVSISRLGTRVRVAGGDAAGRAAAAGPPSRKELRPLHEALDRSFPGAVQWPQAQAWQGTRAALADGLPAVGASGVDGIWLNVGHAHHGWPLSQAAAAGLCAMMAGQPAPPEFGALAPQRLR